MTVIITLFHDLWAITFFLKNLCVCLRVPAFTCVCGLFDTFLSVQKYNCFGGGGDGGGSGILRKREVLFIVFSRLPFFIVELPSRHTHCNNFYEDLPNYTCQ